MTKQKYFTHNEAIETLIEVIDTYAIDYYEDLHHYAFNEDYYIVGTYKAKKALEQYGTFDAIEKVQTYEQNNFGEVLTDLGNPEAVANMLWYIIGYETLNDYDQRIIDGYDDLINNDITTIDFINILNNI